MAERLVKHRFTTTTIGESIRHRRVFMLNPDFDKLMDSLRKAPRQVIHGVVYPSGVGASMSQGDALWHLTFSLAAWSRPDGPVQRSKVLVRREVGDSELETYRRRLPDYGIVALEVGLVEHPPYQGTQALLHALLPEPSASSELFRIAEELRQPVTTNDQQFGTFTLDRRINWHEAQTFWGRESVRLTLNSEGMDEAFPRDSLAHAKTLWSEQQRWGRDIRSYMVNKLLDLKNDSWLEEDEAELTAEEFLQRVALESIAVSSNGSFEFWYNDGDLFWGHSIMVHGSLEGGLDDAGIHG